MAAQERQFLGPNRLCFLNSGGKRVKALGAAKFYKGRILASAFAMVAAHSKTV